ncbi:DUF4440 domain-containing protein (plasmid) [Pseudoalteromonas sp. T1lg65]|uniref:nuclear transport factor 2 family protein n=1 Tax=Pseudoalteromonas sp. T1lg65 TaxID=2077101 RepID=UPI003F7B00A9
MDILIQQEIALHQYHTRQSKSEINRLLHPQFYETGMSGNSYNFNAIVAMMEKEKPSNTTIHSQDYESIKLGDQAYLLVYKSAVVSGLGQVNYFAKRSSVWIRNNAYWQLRYHQGTPCEPFELQPPQGANLR